MPRYDDSYIPVTSRFQKHDEFRLTKEILGIDFHRRRLADAFLFLRDNLCFCRRDDTQIVRRQQIAMLLLFSYSFLSHGGNINHTLQERTREKNWEEMGKDTSDLENGIPFSPYPCERVAMI